MARKPKLQPKEEDTTEVEYVDEEWQQLISDIYDKDVPLHMLKTLKAEMDDGRKYIFPISEWLSDGNKEGKVVSSIQEWYRKNHKEIVGSEFSINIELVKDTVAPITAKTLKDM